MSRNGDAYMGKFLLVDLSTGSMDVTPVDPSLKEDFVGGKGFGARLLYDLLPPGLDPFSPQNVIMFLPGPLTGTMVPSMRSCVVSKSPLTGTFVDSYYGGHFGQELRYAGFDGLIIKGHAFSPVYLMVNDERFELRDASGLWGRSTFETSRMIKQELKDSSYRIACIGPAGEKMVRFALVSCDPNRQAGRGGIGAVMGSKNLKAIAIRGTKAVRVHDPQRFKSAVLKAWQELAENSYTQDFRDNGTPSSVSFANEEGLLPAFNYRQGSFKKVHRLDADSQRKRLWLRDLACAGCPIRCSKVGVIRRTKYAHVTTDIVEYESVALMGSNLGLGDLEGVAYAVRLCDELGMDSMSTGGVIGFIMEALEKGAITTSDLGGLDLKFGDWNSVIELVKMIASRQNPLARLLGEGVKRASEHIPGTEEYAVHIKGLESPAWGPRGAPGMGLALMTADRGGCHQRAFPILYEVGGELWEDRQIERLEIKGKAELVVDLQNYLAALDTLVKCDFAQYGITKKTYLEMLSSAIGREYCLDDLMRLGERVWNMVRLFNIREGFGRKDDHLPPRFVKEPLPDGPAAGHRITEEDMEVMLDEYYKVRRWDGEGRPSHKKLVELGLDRLRIFLKF